MAHRRGHRARRRRTVRGGAAHLDGGVGESVAAARAVAPREAAPPLRVAVCVSRTGTNLRSLVASSRAGRLPLEVVHVVSDRECPALDWARENGLPSSLVNAEDAARLDDELCALLSDVRPDVVALAGFMRLLGPQTLGRFGGRIVNVHPSLLPAFPGPRAVRDALAAGVRTTGVTIHLVDEHLDAGPILLQEPVAVRPGDDESSLLARVHAVEHRLLAQSLLLLGAGAVGSLDGRVEFDPDAAANAMLPAWRALISVSDKTGVGELARGLAELGLEIVSTGGTAAAIRDAGVEVTDLALLSGADEMLDGRVKTLHPRIHGGILADRSRASHRAQLAAGAIAPFALVVVNLYPFAKAAEREGISLGELVEEIDIGGPALIRAAAKNHASVAVVTSSDRYGQVLGELRDHREVAAATRANLAVDAFRHVAAYDARIAAELPSRMAKEGASSVDTRLAGATDPFPASLPVALEKVETLRYGENPHQAAALYRRPGTSPSAGPFARGADLLQGKALSYNNVLDASAAVAAARDLRPPACVIVKHTNPCGAAERGTLLEAWEAALAGDPVSAFGGVAALTGEVDAALAESLAAIFLEVVAAPSFSADALATLSSKPNLRLLAYPELATPLASVPADPLAELRSAGGGVLVGSPDASSDDPVDWKVATTRSPSPAEWRDLDIAWRIGRHVRSNAIVLVRDGAVVGVGAGQMSRVDAARLAVEKAGHRARGASCASDAFYPFADAVEVCLAAGVDAFAQPGGSIRDAEVIGAAESKGATMVLTGRRHFRH